MNRYLPSSSISLTVACWPQKFTEMALYNRTMAAAIDYPLQVCSVATIWREISRICNALLPISMTCPERLAKNLSN